VREVEGREGEGELAQEAGVDELVAEGRKTEKSEGALRPERRNWREMCPRRGRAIARGSGSAPGSRD
jgi:hypothetical protein